MTESDWRVVQARTSQRPSGGGETDLDQIHYFENFSGGSNGTRVDTFTSFNACNLGIVDTSRAYPGGNDRSMNSTIRSGTTGWTDWGFVWERSRNGQPGPLRVYSGGEIWFRVAVYLPSNWTWQSSGHSERKGFRYYKTKGTGDRDQQNSMNWGINRSGTYRVNTEGGLPDTFVSTGTSADIGTWTMMETYVKVSSFEDSVVGEYRTWKNGAIVHEPRPCTILRTTADFVVRHMYNTYWNQQSDTTQDCNYAQVAFAYRGPTNDGEKNDPDNMARDASGFPYIGMAVQ